MKIPPPLPPPSRVSPLSPVVGNTLIGTDGPSSPIQGRFSSQTSFNSGTSGTSGASADAAGGSRSSTSAHTSGGSGGSFPESRPSSRGKDAAAAAGTTSAYTQGPTTNFGHGGGKDKRLVEEGAQSTSAVRAADAGAAAAAVATGKPSKGLRFSSRGRARGRAQRKAPPTAAAAQGDAQESDALSSSSLSAGSPPPPPYESFAESDGPCSSGADRVEEGGASGRRGGERGQRQTGAVAGAGTGPGRPLSVECQKKALAAGRAAAAGGGTVAEVKRVEGGMDEQEEGVGGGGGDGRMPASVLKSSGSFRVPGEQRSVSFADASGDSSDVDGLQEGGARPPRGGASNTASTLRQVRVCGVFGEADGVVCFCVLRSTWKKQRGILVFIYSRWCFLSAKCFLLLYLAELPQGGGGG